MTILFTVDCGQCQRAFDWDIENTPEAITLVPEGGYQLACPNCEKTTVYHEHNQIRETQF